MPMFAVTTLTSTSRGDETLVRLGQLLPNPVVLFPPLVYRAAQRLLRVPHLVELTTHLPADIELLLR